LEQIADAVMVACPSIIQDHSMQNAKQEASIDRTSLDGRIAIVVTAFLFAYGCVALLDRVGAPERLVTVVSPYFTIIALAAIGFLLHSMRISFYYAAGRAVPACYAGFANAAIMIGLALPFVARLTNDPPPPGAFAGFLAGVAALALLSGPILRKTGAFSLSDLLSTRFSHLAPRLGIIVATAASSALVAIAGYQTAVDALSGFTQTSRPFGAFVIGAAVLMIAGPGGLSGVIWTASAAAGVMIAGFGWPILALWRAGVTPPAPGFDSQAFDDALVLIDSWRTLPAASGLGLGLATMLAVALGVFTLAPALAPAVTTPEAKAARRAGFANFGWTLLMSLMITATVGLSTLSITRLSIGQPPDRLTDAIYAASARGFVKICGASVEGPAAARRVCAARGLGPGAPLRAEDLSASGEFLLGGLPQLAGLGGAASGLLASGFIALGLALASSGLQACATALGHEGVYRLRGETALTSRRLAITRFALTAVTAIGFATSSAGGLDSAYLVGVAFAISAACVAPVLALAFWPRARDRDAVVAQLVGLIALAGVIFVSDGALRFPTLVWAALAGFAAGLTGGILSSLSAPQAAPESHAFVEKILRGDAEASVPDKGV
jgi:cation/acetate symporter